MVNNLEPKVTCGVQKIMVDTETLVSRLDESPLPNRFRVTLAKRILEKCSPFDPAELAVLSITGMCPGPMQSDAIEEVWRRLKANYALPSSYRERLVIAAIPSGEELDGYSAEYFLSWARSAGFSDEEAGSILMDICADGWK